MASCRIHRLLLEPPILNSSCLWASSRQQLEELFASQFTGGATTRTATLSGFKEDADVHKHALIDKNASINSYGYSPHPLSQYLTWIRAILTSRPKSRKPFIISVAPASTRELSSMLDIIQELRHELHDTLQPGFSRIGIELNTSCPNIPGHPPPAYDAQSLIPLLRIFQDRFAQDPTLTMGLKLAPYVHSDQYKQVIHILAKFSTEASEGKISNCISFLTCTNTLGSSVVFHKQTTMHAAGVDADNSIGLPAITGGLAGEPIHALSLGNVYSFRRLLSEHPDLPLRQMAIIGVGGITSPEAVTRMRTVGASAVACATVLGTCGVGVFQQLNAGL